MEFYSIVVSNILYHVLLFKLRYEVHQKGNLIGIGDGIFLIRIFKCVLCHQIFFDGSIDSILEVFYTILKINETTKTCDKYRSRDTNRHLKASFPGRCLHHLDDGSPISSTVFSSILVDVTTFQHAIEKCKCEHHHQIL